MKKVVFLYAVLSLFISFNAFSGAYIKLGLININTRGKCSYSLEGTLAAVKWWSIDTLAAVPCNSKWERNPSSTKSGTLNIKWKNVEASARPQLVGVFY